MTVWEESDWQLYTQAIEIKMPCLIICKAVRYGWKESEESTFIVSEELSMNLKN